MQKQAGWMFWGSFHGTIKGPFLFWEKDWGTINAESYIAHTIPMIDGYFRMNPNLGLQVMQDNASSHAARLTMQEFQERNIPVIFWPAYSPDLNSIETVWNRMKDWLAFHYPERKASYDQLRQRVTEAWEAIGEDLLEDLIDTMPQRCQAVIDANGMYIPW